jgi:hypothetical protein
VAWLRTSATKTEEDSQSKAATPAADESVKELGWKVEGNTSTLKGMQGRLNALVGLNAILLLALLATFACGGAYLLLPGLRERLTLPSGAATAVAGVTTPVATAAPTSAGGTQPVVATEGAATQVADGTQTLTCADADQAKSFYDCVVTNLDNGPQSLKFSIVPYEVNGFFYSVQVAGKPAQPDTGAGDLAPGEAQFDLGPVSSHDSVNIRVGLACTSASGCKSTLFKFRVITPVNDELPNNQVQINTSYTPR